MRKNKQPSFKKDNIENMKLKVALVHDYIREYGGAERVLKELSDLFPEAPIYTAFKVSGSTAEKEFSRGRKIIESRLAPLLKMGKLYSPLRFLIPAIWGSFDLSDYDLVVTSCSWYITRGFKVSPKTKVVAYCHTPPRWLYGYETSVGFTKYWPVKVYAAIVGHFMRMYDFATAQKIDYWITNSKNVADRIEKFYRKESVVIYPPVNVEEIKKTTRDVKKEDFYLITSRLVGAKGIEVAVEVSTKLGVPLKIAGEAFGFSDILKKIAKGKKDNVELLGYVSEEEKFKLMARAKAFIALARDEDFGITPVEAQAAGTPVVAFNGGGFRESVVEGKTGTFINSLEEKEIREAFNRIEKTKWNRDDLQRNASRFDRTVFVRKIKSYLDRVLGNKNA